MPTSHIILGSNEASGGSLERCHVRSLLCANSLIIVSKPIIIDAVPISRTRLPVIRCKRLGRIRERIVPWLLALTFVFGHKPPPIVLEVVVQPEPEVPEVPAPHY